MVSQCPWNLVLQTPSALFLEGSTARPGQAGRQAGNSTCQEGNYAALAPVRPLQKRAGHEFDCCWAGRDLRTGS